MLLKHQRQLIESGAVSAEQMAKVLEEHDGKKERFVLHLLTSDGVNVNDVIRALARIYKLPFLDISNMNIPTELFQRCGEKMCKSYKIAPISELDNAIAVAMVDPMNFAALDALRFKFGKQVRPLFALPDAINRKIQEAFHAEDEALQDAMGALDDGTDVTTEEEEEEEESSAEALKKSAAESPVVKMVNGIIIQAIKTGSSDIHIEAGEKGSQVRVRIDGRLRPIIKFPRKLHSVLVSRIKIMSSLDISNTRTPQDGRARLKVAGKNYDMRISTLPSMNGEKVVMRILDKSGLSLSLDILGFEPLADQRVRECISRSTGAVLVTGPTGSGKTTTLYSFLNHINTEDSNLITVEDPVEFQLKGINQVQVNVKAGMTFSAALRSILRQDPDVVMLGEIRDEETAEIAMHAAQTGHVVLSTLHTNDAPSTITRLTEMGIDHASLSASLNMVVAQRLARRLCKCKVEEPIDPAFAKRFEIPLDLVFYGPKKGGCKRCMGIGYKGRVAVHEVLYVNDRMREAIAAGASTRVLMQVAREEQMYQLFEAAFNQALLGLTSMDEVMHQAAPPEDLLVEPRLREDGTMMSLGEFKKGKGKRKKKDPNAKRTVLIVDDSKSIRRLLTFVLRADGFDVTEAGDGQEAWDILQNDPPDVTITDYEMPNMTGPELIRKIRETPAFDGMPAIMLTSRREEEDEVLGLESGADDYLGKPVEPLKLQVRVKKVLSMYDRIRLAAVKD
ncbi:MAG: type II/IV secretion system protein [Mariprofundales bacterium]